MKALVKVAVLALLPVFAVASGGGDEGLGGDEGGGRRV